MPIALQSYISVLLLQKHKEKIKTTCPRRNTNTQAHIQVFTEILSWENSAAACLWSPQSWNLLLSDHQPPTALQSYYQFPPVHPTIASRVQTRFPHRLAPRWSLQWQTERWRDEPVRSSAPGKEPEWRVAVGRGTSATETTQNAAPKEHVLACSHVGSGLLTAAVRNFLWWLSQFSSRHRRQVLSSELADIARRAGFSSWDQATDVTHHCPYPAFHSPVVYT